MNTALSSLAAWTPLANHLWQSSLFAAATWLLTLALKKNRAAVRYWLWFAASVKFLLPFSALVAFGNRFSWQTAAVVVQAQWTYAIDNAIQPFAAPMASAQIASPHASLSLAPILLAVWLCGVVVGIAFWLKCWTQMRSIRRNATPLPLGLPILVLSSPSQIEPGVFGIFRPVLLLPASIGERLTPEQLNAILAHEMAHVRRRDNLTAAIHMLVETIFWFFPLVWWLRARLIEERELACDEEVLRLGSEPESFAEGIIQVCKSYVESPVPCVSGISGFDLKRRVIHILNNRCGTNLTSGKKVLLGVLSIGALVGPFAIGLTDAPAVHAQAAQSKPPTGSSASSFEVVSVKPNNSGAQNDHFSFAPGRYTVTNTTAKNVIKFAYDVRDFQISGTPAWVDTERFDIDATAGQQLAQEWRNLSRGQQIEQIRPMVQALLADRFKMSATHVVKELPVYALVVANGGPKLTASNDQGNSTFRIDGAPAAVLTAKNQPIDALVLMLSQQLDYAVVDRSGLKGNYDFVLRWTPSLSSAPSTGIQEPANTDAPSIFTALQEQLGLRVESTKGPVETIVIDHIEKPTPN